MVCTTEVGLWANCLIRAARYTSNDKFTALARDAVRAYLRFGYDEENDAYFGQIAVRNGQPVVPDTRGYWPRKHSDTWNPDQWPTHDYPMKMAEACIELHEITGDPIFRQAVERWGEIARRSSTSDRKSAYAGQYATCIHFLVRAADVLDSPELLHQAHVLADETVERLFENGWFQGYPGSHIYESVDGVGDLMLVLMEFPAGGR